MLVMLSRLVPLAATLALFGLASAAHAAGSESGTSAETTPASTKRMDEFVLDRMDVVGVPGVAYTIVGPRGPLHSGTFGTDGDGRPVTASTPFLWGSIAKPVTATLAMSLVESGELRLDAPVTAYLPSFRLADQEVSDRITVRQLLNQTSGLPASLELTDRFDEGRRPADALPSLADMKTTSEPGTEHHYSSLNYLVLSAVIEDVTGERFGGVLADRVLDPIGMRDAVLSPERAEARVPPGHRFVFGQAVGFTTPYDAAGVGYGYLGGTLEDLAAFARANLGGQREVLSDRQREEMQRGDVATGDGRSYGLGWRRWPMKDFAPGTGADMVWHGGAVAGYQAMTILLPEQDRAVVVLQNAYGTFQEARLLDTGFGLTTLMCGDEPSTSDAGITYPAVLGTLVTVCTVLLVLVGRSLWVLARPGAHTPSRRRIGIGLGAWLVATTAVIYAFGSYLPNLWGVGLDQIVLWAPDIAWLAHAILVLAAILLVSRIAVAVREMLRV